MTIMGKVSDHPRKGGENVGDHPWEGYPQKLVQPSCGRWVTIKRKAGDHDKKGG